MASLFEPCCFVVPGDSHLHDALAFHLMHDMLGVAHRTIATSCGRLFVIVAVILGPLSRLDIHQPPQILILHSPSDLTSHKQHLTLLLHCPYVLLFIVFFDHVDRLFNFAEHQVTVAVVCLRMLN